VTVDDSEQLAAFLAELGSRIRRARETVPGMTQSRLEREAGLTPTTISRVERGEADLLVAELVVVAGVLGVNPAGLIPALGRPGAS
jgi:transcriptional regulator with XRE-family HTH domain